MKIDILFLDGLEPRHLSISFLSYLFPIAALLEENSFNFKILNLSTLPDYSIKGLVNELLNYEFGAIAMTTNSDNIRFVYKICETLKKKFVNTPIILGGPQVTYSDKKTLNDCKCDVIIRNEGEYKLLDVLNYFKSKIGSLHDINGITFREGETVFRNPDSESIDFNNLPVPQYAILKDKKYWILPKTVSESKFEAFLELVKLRHLYFVTGRGCPYKCVFCVEGNIKKKFRYRNPENVKKDLEYFISITGARYIAIADDTFTSSPKRVKDICKVIKIVQKENPFVWFAEGRVDVLSKYPELIGIMKDAGMYRLQIGIESGNQNVLNLYNKHINLEQIENVLVEASKYDNLYIHGNIILGNPKESYQDFIKSLDFIERLYSLSNFKLDITWSYLAAFEGTPLRLFPENYDIELLFDNFEFKRFGMTDITCKPKNFTTNEINQLSMIASSKLIHYLRNNIFSLTKKEIDKRLKYFESYKGELISYSWNQSFNSLQGFHHYREIINKKTTLYSDNVKEYKELVPLRLWEIEYSLEKDAYIFNSFSGKKNVLINTELALWEQASGKNTLNEIYENLKDKGVSIEYIYKYYKYLEENLAIVFKDF